MRLFNTAGLTRKALQETYEIVLEQKLCYEAKLERMKKELATAYCAIEDGVVDLEQIKKGLANLMLYCEKKINLEHELTDMEAMKLIEVQEEEIKKYALDRLKKR